MAAAVFAAAASAVAWVAWPQPGVGHVAEGRFNAITPTLGTATTVLMLKSPWLLHWLNQGRHMSAFVTYRYELYTVNHTGAYVLMLMSFPVIGLFMSYLAAAIANPAPSQPQVRSSGPGLPVISGE
jgi:hypothetical protein